MLVRKIDETKFNSLSDELKKEYKKDGDSYVLEVEGIEDIGALKRAKDRESQHRKDAEKKLKELEEKLAETDEIDARKKGDIETLEKSWKEKLETQKQTLSSEIDKLRGYTRNSLVDSVAMKLAQEISTSPSLILPHIKSRLTADFDADSPVTKVLDLAGKPSALTVDELKAELLANKDFSPILIASKASGGAGANPTKVMDTSSASVPADYSKMSPSAMVTHIDESKVG